MMGQEEAGELLSEDALHQALRRHFGFATFRPGQQQVIEAVFRGKDVLAIFPTGGGKSLCYQLPAVMVPGIVLVLSPLIALMEDQVYGLRQKGIPSVALHSNLSRGEVQRRMHLLQREPQGLLYVAPERLQDEQFQRFLRVLPLRFIAVDEAHCISEWGHDFRPAYRLIPAFFQRLAYRPPVIALTATATPEVRQDIIDTLQLQQPVVIVQSFYRKNLFLDVVRTEQKEAKVLQALEQCDGAAICYGATRQQVERLTHFLHRNGIAALQYHAGMKEEQRNFVHEEFLRRSRPVIVATSAFGMGIDKPNIRAVIHYAPPLTLEGYYQQVGRAGRDGASARALCLYHRRDFALLKQLIAYAYPPEPLVQRVYESIEAVMRHSSDTQWQSLNVQQLAEQAEVTVGQVQQVLRFLQKHRIFQWWEVAPALKVQITTSRERLEQLYGSFPEEQRRYLEALLRTVGSAAFAEPVEIDLHQVSRKYGLEAHQFALFLQSLEQRRIVRRLALSGDLIRSSTLPPFEQLPIDWKHLERRRMVALRKLQQLWAFLESASCKFQLLLQYFGESFPQSCGHCVSCVQHPPSSVRAKAERSTPAPHQQSMAQAPLLQQQQSTVEANPRTPMTANRLQQDQTVEKTAPKMGQQDKHRECGVRLNGAIPEPETAIVMQEWRRLRQRWAKQLQREPLTIVTDAQLTALLPLRPAILQTWQKSGVVSEFFLQTCASSFLQTLERLWRQKLPYSLRHTAAAAVSGYSLTAIARRRRLKEATIARHLATLLLAGYPLDPARCVAATLIRQVGAYLQTAPQATVEEVAQVLSVPFPPLCVAYAAVRAGYSV